MTTSIVERRVKESRKRSHGFGVVHFPLESIVEAFKEVGIDAYFDEATPDRDVRRKLAACRKLHAADWQRISDHLLKRHRSELQTFLDEIEVSLTRTIQTVAVMGLHGRCYEARTLDEAIRYLEAYDESKGIADFCRYEVVVRYANGDEVRASFKTKLEAIRYLVGLG